MLALAAAAAAASPPLPASPRGALSPPGSPANRRRPPPPRLEPRRRPASAAAAAAAASLYEVLRVERTASPTEIKGAYRTLAKLYHPDALSPVEAGSDGRDFLEIHDAYATLSDPSARALYDLSLGSLQQGRPSSGAAWCCPSRRWETDQCW